MGKIKVIQVDLETREALKKLGGKGETYDHVIRELIYSKHGRKDETYDQLIKRLMGSKR